MRAALAPIIIRIIIIIIIIDVLSVEIDWSGSSRRKAYTIVLNVVSIPNCSRERALRFLGGVRF